MSWKDDKNLGPWPFVEQPDKWGYLNNPRWSSQADAIAFCQACGLSLDLPGQHLPCGHWHKTPVYVTTEEEIPPTPVSDCVGGWSKVEMSDNAKYISLAGPYCICRSDDFGVTWASVLEGNFFEIGMSADGKYQTAIARSDTNSDVWFSDDYGLTWAMDTPGEYSYKGIAISSDGQYQTLVTWADQILISSDYGSSWTARGLTKYYFDVAMSSNGQWQVVISNGGFVYVSNNYGLTWTEVWFAFWGPVGDGCFPYRICMSSDGSVIVGAAASASSWGSHYYSADHGASWARSNVSLYRYRSKDVACSSSGKYATLVCNSQLIQVSDTFGASYVDRGLDMLWRGVAISSSGETQIAVTSAPDPNDNIHKSTDYGVTWVPVVRSSAPGGGGESGGTVIVKTLVDDEPQVWPMPA